MMINQATWERAVRIAAGVALLAFGYLTAALPLYGQIALMGVGVVLIITGLLAYCPAWHMLGISTKHRDSTAACDGASGERKI